jgi:metal-responsive CopG/Arc/MetJ family transcriptional regulator
MTIYKSISIPADLCEGVEKMIGSCGYVSASDFVKDAIRRRLEELRVDGV